MNDTFKQLSDFEIHELIRLRRLFHTHPERAWTEKWTTGQIRSYLEALGIRTKSLGLAGKDTGLLCIICQSDGPFITLRFDIDGLPIAETKDPGHLPVMEGFSSVREGFMHACGHDGHIAIGLMTARILYENRARLKGTVQIIFQPAEEGGQGARPIVSTGILDQTDLFLAGHIVPQSQYPMADGDFIITDSSFATTKLDVSFHGKAAHAAHPSDGQSVMPAIGAAITELYKLTEGKNDRVLNVGTVSAGTNRNILADYGKMVMEVRAKDTKVNEQLTGQAIQVIGHAAKLHHVTEEICIVGSAPVVKSTKKLSALLQKVFHDPVNKIKASSTISCAFMASEDAGHMMEAVKSHGGEAAYLLFPAKTTAVLHQPDYDFDENVLKKAVLIYCRTVFEILSQNP